MMRKKISNMQLFLILLGASLIYACGILVGAVEGVIAGLIIGIAEVNLINMALDGKLKYFLLATIINTGLTILLLTTYCMFFVNLVCQRNPLFLSVIPGLLLTVVWLPLTLHHIFIWIKSALK